MLLLEAVLKTIKQDNLLENTVKAGDVLLKGLKAAEKQYPGMVHSARGIGTYCAIDCDTSARQGGLHISKQFHGSYSFP